MELSNLFSALGLRWGKETDHSSTSRRGLEVLWQPKKTVRNIAAELDKLARLHKAVAGFRGSIQGVHKRLHQIMGADGAPSRMVLAPPS